MIFLKESTNLVKHCAVVFQSDASGVVKSVQQLAGDATDK